MIVVDTNLLVYLYVSGANTAQAERVLVRDPVLAAFPSMAVSPSAFLARR